MKKLLFAAIMMGFMSTSVYAGWWGDATISEIQQIGPQAYIKGTMNSSNAAFTLRVIGDNTEETKKKLIAIALTAQSTNATVNLNGVCGAAGCDLWGIAIK